LGRTAGGATRWIPLGPFALQPSELIKPFLVMQSARFFGHWDKWRWQVRLFWLGLFGCLLVGILAQPNLSTTALCGMSLWLIALSAGLRLRYLLGAAFGGLALAAMSISVNAYQRDRITFFLDPWQDPLGKGYQLIQSLLAIASGGLWGSGYGMSQQKLYHLPIRSTDFIFAVFGEEFGFIGSVLLILSIIIYATIAILVAIKSRHPIHRAIATGVAIFMTGQSFLNIGVASGALPTTGLPLPLFSYGGSSVIASLLLAAMLIRVARESNQADIVSFLQKK
jgi:cell division protein FtsW